MRKRTIQERYEQQIEQTRASCEEAIREKFQARKINMSTICDKKDLHFMLNSFLHGDVFQEDILNEFWDHYFFQTALIADVARAYNNGIMYVLGKIIEDNFRLSELTKEKQKYKQNHDFKSMNTLIMELDHLSVDINQYTNDLHELCKPFDIDLTPIVNKYKPLKSKEKDSNAFQNADEQIELGKKLVGNAYQLSEMQSNLDSNQPKKLEQLRREQKFYRFVIYLSILVSIGDISLSFSKYNFVDLITMTLLLLNSLFERYLLKDDPFEQKLEYIEINYAQNKIFIQESQPTTFVKSLLQKNQPREHKFQKYAYSSLNLLAANVIFDILWLLIIRDQFMFEEESAQNPLVLSLTMWKYNHYVVYASVIVLVFKILMLFLYLNMVDFECSKFWSRCNFQMNFIRFSSFSYLSDLIKVEQTSAS